MQIHRSIPASLIMDNFIKKLAEGRRVKIKRGDVVKIKTEWQDQGDDKFKWVALEDEDGGRVRIQPVDIGLAIIPNQIVETAMLEDEYFGTSLENKGTE